MIPADPLVISDSYYNVSEQFQAVLWLLFILSICSSIGYFIKVYVVLKGKDAVECLRKRKVAIIKFNDKIHILSIFSMLSGII
jgi:hypothetical protein